MAGAVGEVLPPLGVDKDGLGRSWCAGTPAERGGDTLNPFHHPTGKSQSRDACDHQTVVWTIPCGRREGRKVVLGQVIPSRVSRFFYSNVLVGLSEGHSFSFQKLRLNRHRCIIFVYALSLERDKQTRDIHFM
jgi:hypothetical protein